MRQVRLRVKTRELRVIDRVLRVKTRVQTRSSECVMRVHGYDTSPFDSKRRCNPRGCRQRCRQSSQVGPEEVFDQGQQTSSRGHGFDRRRIARSSSHGPGPFWHAR